MPVIAHAINANHFSDAIGLRFRKEVTQNWWNREFFRALLTTRRQMFANELCFPRYRPLQAAIYGTLLFRFQLNFLLTFSERTGLHFPPLFSPLLASVWLHSVSALRQTISRFFRFRFLSTKKCYQIALIGHQFNFHLIVFVPGECFLGTRPNLKQKSQGFVLCLTK